MPETPSKSEHIPLLKQLLTKHRWAALATLDRHGYPEGAMVALVMDEGLSEGYLHLSQLASHTRNLLERPQVALTISEADRGEGDPQQLARLSLQGEVRRLAPEDASYPTARARYLATLPDAEMRFGFGDFQLFAFRWHSARLVGGFGRAYSFRPQDLEKGAGGEVKPL